MSGNSSKRIAFSYFGGKFTFLEELYAHFPAPNQFDHFVDLFAGSFVVSLNYQHNRPLIKTANEINSEITNFFQVLRDQEQDLIKLLNNTPVSYLEYERCWKKSDDKLEQARRFYVRAQQSFLGFGSQYKNKGWQMAKTQPNAHGGVSVSKWNNAIPKLQNIANILRQNFQITPWSYETCIGKLDHQRAFFYCDPPYPKESRTSFNDYSFEFTDEDHRSLAKKLHNIEGLAMVSGYDCDLLNSLYSTWNKFYLRMRKNNMRLKPVQEVVWCNYEVPRWYQRSLWQEFGC